MNNKISYPETGFQNCYAVEDQSFWFQHRNRIIQFEVKKYLKAGDAFCDIGGGNGFVSQMLQNDLGLDVTLVEPGGGADMARKRQVKKVVHGTLEDLPAHPPLQNAGLFDVVEHIEDDVKFLTSLHQKMIVDGMVFLTVPAYQWLWSSDDVHAGHYRRYNRRSITSALEEAGFSVRECRAFFPLLVLPIYLLKTLRSGSEKNSKSAPETPTTESDHAVGLWWRPLIDPVFKIELALFRWRLLPPFGSSLIVVAQKK
jgi:2-polyprenyl-3-methyl-5-hydroxy-6-metoxy-1,4-benzoquinol methylase